MDHQPQSRRESVTFSSTTTLRSELDPEFDLQWPFGKIEGLDKEDLRETAYEIFFTACRSSPGFGGKTALTHNLSTQDNGDGGLGLGGVGNGRTNGLGLVSTSKVKRALGLKTMKRISPKKPTSNPCSPRVSNSNPNSGFGFGGGGGFGLTTPLIRLKRPLTSAEIMRQQMKVSEQSDNRLRKTLMRTLVGQVFRNVSIVYNVGEK